MNFTFRNSNPSSSRALASVDVGGTTINITRGSYQSGHNTNYTISVEGIGRPTFLGPQKALAIIAAAKEIEAYFREVGVIE